MYCVMCGMLLHAANQEGILCRDCKRGHQGNRGTRDTAICVNYCYTCGMLYHPHDTSIQHTSCAVVPGTVSSARQR